MAHLIGSVSLGSNVYSMRDIAKYEQINKERIENLMKQTLSKAVSSSENKSPAVIQVFFNEVGVYDTNINAFIRHSRLEPFAKAIRLKIEKCRRGNGEINYAMFYVPKKVYEDWRKRHIAYNASVQPKMSEYGLPEKIGRRVISIKSSPEFEHFEKKVTALGFQTGEAVTVALIEYMTRHKDVFGEIPHSKMIEESKIRENKMSLIHAYIDPNVTNSVYKMLQRYNSVNHPYVKFSEFVEAALKEKLDRVSVKYTDPELYKEMLAAQKAEAEYLKSRK